MKRPTLSDVAQVAGVSYASADRVINNRGNVAKKTVEKVNQAVRQLGYVRNFAAANLSRGQTYRILFLLPKSKNDFFNTMFTYVESIKKHLRQEQVYIDIHQIDAFKSHDLNNELTAISKDEFDGVALVGLSSDEIIPALKNLKEKNIQVVSLVSDLPESYRSAYIGIDNIAAGKTAGRFVGMSHANQNGTALVLLGSISAKDHADRLSGFNEIMSNEFPNIEILPFQTTEDKPESIKKIITESLRNNKSISAIYNIGAGNKGLLEAINKIENANKIFCVVHELVDLSLIHI